MVLQGLARPPTRTVLLCPAQNMVQKRINEFFNVPYQRATRARTDAAGTSSSAAGSVPKVDVPPSATALAAAAASKAIVADGSRDGGHLSAPAVAETAPAQARELQDLKAVAER